LKYFRALQAAEKLSLEGHGSAVEWTHAPAAHPR
jgi:hypothetical protein